MFFKFDDSDKLKNRIRCYPEVEFLIYSANVILNKRIDEGQNIHSGSYIRNEINIDREINQRIQPYIYRDQYYDAIDGTSVYSTPLGEVINGTYLNRKSYQRYYITSSADPIAITVDRYFQLYKHRFSGVTDGSLANFDFNNEEFTVFMFDRDIFGQQIKPNTLEINRYENNELIYSLIDNNGILGRYVDNVFIKQGYVLHKYGIVIIQYDLKQELNLYNTGDSITVPNSAFRISFKGVNDVQNMTLFCKVDKRLNNSNNPTYILKNQNIFLTQSSSDSFKENDKLLIKNLNNNKYIQKNVDYINESLINGNMEQSYYDNITFNTASIESEKFEKGVYINSINIYDKNKNLIAIANLANPLRKTENDSYIIKLSYDL